MELECLFLTARSASFAIKDGGAYHTQKPYRLLLNEEEAGMADTVVCSLYGLKPDADYELKVLDGEEQVAGLCFHTQWEAYTLNVRRFGALGDDLHDDTPAIQAAILACPEHSRVLIPRGTYRVTPLFLKSNINIELAKGAELRLCTDRKCFPVLPGLLERYDEQQDLNLGTWEGNPLDCYAAMLTGINVENVNLYGQGLVDGQAHLSDWWHEPKKKRGAWRGRLLFLNHCRNVSVQGLTFQNSPSWNLHPYFSDDLGFYQVNVFAPANSPNTDGFDPESCRNVRLAGAHFSLGDDCIAIKSGKLYMGNAYQQPCQGLEIMHCLMENGHGGVTVGSEMAGGVRDVWVHDCVMSHTDRGLRVKTRRGRGKNGVIDQVRFERIQMQHVSAPFVVNSMYFCDPDGHSDYVQTREALPVDDRTPEIGTLRFRDIRAEGCGSCAGYFLGLPEKKIKELSLENCTFTYAPDAIPMVPLMAGGVDPCIRKGLVAVNVEKMLLHNVSIEDCDGEAVICENVGQVERGE